VEARADVAGARGRLCTGLSLIKKVILGIICQNQHSSQPVKPFLVFTVRDTGSITIKSAWPVLGSS
jgi:hypothetical protein